MNERVLGNPPEALSLERDSIDSLAKIVVSLTNLKLRAAPLIADESIYNPDPSVGEGEESEELVPTQAQVQHTTSQTAHSNTRSSRRHNHQ